MMELQAIITQHWNDRTSSYHANMKADFMSPKLYRQWRELIRHVLGERNDLVVLDGGCGTGVISHIIANHGQHDICAVDISEEMLNTAKGNLSAWADRIEFCCNDMSTLPYADNSFDCIISRYVLWTVVRPELVLREWQRVLKPGGKIAIIDGNWYRGYYRSTLIRGWTHCVQSFYRLRNKRHASQKLATGYADSLPHTHLLRPDWDIGLLSGLGFVEVTVTRNISRKIYGISWQRLLNPFSGQFLIEAIKPDDLDLTE